MSKGSLASGQASVMLSPKGGRGDATKPAGRTGSKTGTGSPSESPRAGPVEAPPSSPNFEGWLKKKSARGLPGMHTWQRRYYVLDANGLHWYDDESKKKLGQTGARGSIGLGLLAGADDAEKKGPTRFVINVRNARKGPMHPKHIRAYELEADSVPMMRRWLELMQRHLEQIQQATEAAQHGTNLRATLPSGFMPNLRATLPGGVPSPMVPLDDRGGPVRMTINSWGQPVPVKEGDSAKTTPGQAVRAGGAGVGSARGAGGASAPADSGASSSDGTFTGEALEARLLAVPGNQTCADCMTSDPAHYPSTPSWASTNLGSVFCIRCSGIHRKMGAHITKVLSIRIDTWTEAQLLAMERLGNDAVNAELEAQARLSAPTPLPRPTRARARARLQAQGADRGLSDRPALTIALRSSRAARSKWQVPSHLSKPDLATSSMQELEAYIRAKYELGSFKQGGDGKLGAVSNCVENHGTMMEFVGVLFIRLLMLSNPPSGPKSKIYAECSLADRKTKSKTWDMGKQKRWGASLSLNTKSTKETLIVKVRPPVPARPPAQRAHASVQLHWGSAHPVPGHNTHRSSGMRPRATGVRRGHVWQGRVHRAGDGSDRRPHA